MLHLPQFLAGPWIIGDGPEGRRAHQLRLAVDGEHGRRAERFLVVAVEVAVFEAAVLLPDCLARGPVQGDDVLQVEAVEGEDEQVVVEDGRGGGPAVVVAFQVAPRPERLGRLGVEAGRAVAAEVDVDAPASMAGVGEAYVFIGFLSLAGSATSKILRS